MSGRHRTKSSRSNFIIGSIAASVGVSSVLAAAIVEAVAPDEPTASAPAAPPAAQLQQPLNQQGRLIAVTPESLTTQGADGTVHTFSINSSTTAITDSGENGSPASSFAVNDEVTIVGTQQGDDMVATAVADQSAVGPQGRPMDFGL